MITSIKKLIKNDVVRYVVAGGMTTVVNFVSYYILCHILNMNMNLSNFIAIIIAIAFAYIINKTFVFNSRTNNFKELFLEACSFVGARLFTMVVELVGVFLLVGSFELNDLVSKFIIQFVILVLNYVFSRFIVFKEKKEKKEISFKDFVVENLNYILAFVLPIIILTIVYIIRDIAPFGEANRSMVIIDGLHQYMPFFSEYYNKLKNTESILYSWNGGLGFNFLGLWAYYLSSPLNLFIVLFKKSDLNTALNLIIMIKFALASFCMTYYLGKKVNKKDPKILLFGLCYAFSTYMIGYYWNVMWLESIILLPIIILGLEKLIEKKDGKLYCFALFGSLFCNFYISFIICIFLVIYFLLYKFKNFKDFIRSGILFTVYSLLAGGMAGVVLLPTYKNLMLTGSANSSFPKAEFYQNFFDTLNSALALVKPLNNDNFDGKTNLYCGAIALLCFAIYAFDKKIKWYDKIKKIGLIVFLVFSFNTNVLNYIWHGFHDQYGIPNRFAFVYVFVMLVMTYDVIRNIRTVSNIGLTLGYVLCTGYLLASYQFSTTKPDTLSIGVTWGFITIYLLMFMFYKEKKIKTRIFAYALSGICILEVGGNAIWGFCKNGTIDVERYFGDTDTIAEVVENFDDTEFVRAELNNALMLDESIWHNLKNATMFGSTVNGEVATAMGRLGFYSAPNEYLYKGATPFTNMLFGFKYLITRDGETINTPYTKGETVDNVTVYENSQYLPIGFMLNETLLTDWENDMQNPFLVQNNFVKATLGEEAKPIYDIYDVIFGDQTDLIEYQNCEMTNGPSIHGQYTFAETQGTEKTVTFTVNVKEDDDIYIFPVGNSIKNVRVEVDGVERISINRMSQVVRVGECKAGSQVKVKYELKDNYGRDMVIKFLAAGFNQDALDEVYAEYSKETLKDIEYSSNHVEGTLTTDGGLLFTSISYDPGWSIYVDGEKVDTIAIGKGFLGAIIEEGTHNIEIKFMPQGFILGAILTVLSFSAYVLVEIYLRKNRKKY